MKANEYFKPRWVALQNLTLDPRRDFGKNSGVITNTLHRGEDFCDVISDQAIRQSSVRKEVNVRHGRGALRQVHHGERDRGGRQHRFREIESRVSEPRIQCLVW